MTTPHAPFATGACACGAVRYALASAPYVVHACHCRDCQRLTGSAFAINALIEADRLALLSGSLQPVSQATPSGRGQTILHCSECRCALWSHYGSMGQKVAFVRAGTLDSPALCTPHAHIYTRTRLPWIMLPPGVPAFEAFYGGHDIPLIYSAEGAARLAALRSRAV